jgi:hypothetical protein
VVSNLRNCIPGVDFVVGAAAACIHYSALKGDLSRMEEDQARREMDIKELTAKAAELQATLQKLSLEKSSIVSAPPEWIFGLEQ